MVKSLPSDHEAGILFTYINNENFHPLDEFGPCEVKITNLRKNVEEKSELKDYGNLGLFLNENIKFHPSRYKCGNDFENFYIMADLDPTRILFTIKFRKNDNLFIIYPDFNDQLNAYFLEIDQDSKQIYSYFIENLSTTTNEANKQMKKKKKIDELHTETKELMKKMSLNIRDQNFFYPKFCRLIFMLEIISARDFEFDNIHVRFMVKIPKFVKVVEGILEASTHSSIRKDDTWNIGYCHSLILDIDDEFFMSSTHLDLIEINFEVISIDSLWGRERNEGIACIKIPLNSTKSAQEANLKCFRDLQGGSWISDFLQRFFLGGLRNSRFFNHTQNGVVNLYGNQTVSTGMLQVKIQQIKQIKMSQRHQLKMHTIEEIINCYHKAKSKLE